jgi:23S rRNA (guanine1835-N2)-methyltransferase
MPAPVIPTVMQTPFGAFDLARYPSRPNEALLAWCSADSLLLEEVHRSRVTSSHILAVNDAHGALCVALQPRALWTDSALAAVAMRRNTKANSRAEPQVLWSTQSPPAMLELVVMRVPKSRPFFEYQLSQLARCLPAGATVLAAGMDKHLSAHTATLLEHWIGPTQRLPGQRKARLFRALRDSRPAADFPSTASYFCEPLDVALQGLPNVFSRDQLDGGTRFLLHYLRQLPPVESAIDLACGNGVLGLFAAKHALARTVAFCDESAMALASARANAEQVFPQFGARFGFHHGDGLRDYPGEPVQLILCNPPFHQEHTVNDFAGRHLLSRCSRHLQPGGQLYVVANRHLDYSIVLRREFRRVAKCAGNARFNILMAQKE